ncbi:MAG: hypothetical protein DME18_07965 [Verrucomicrobia bacterium]|nr:MAG: hypothetical protein DME18_07965 [Verrucomicrobiota bacterium]
MRRKLLLLPASHDPAPVGFTIFTFMKLFTVVTTLFSAFLALVCAPLVLICLQLERFRRRPFRVSASGDSLRIAYILTDLWGGKPGGAASHKLGFCKGLQEWDHIPTVLVSQPVPGLDRVVRDYHVLPAPTLPRGFPLTLCVLAKNLAFTRCAYRILTSWRPGVICHRHSHMNYAGVLLSRILKVPFILEYNSPANWKATAAAEGHSLFGWIGRFVEKLNLLATDRIMVVSDVLKQRLVDDGIQPDRIVVNPNGADAELFRPDIDSSAIRQRLQLEGKIVVGFAGHHNSNNTWHGTKYLAMAVRKVAERRKDVQFLFIGDQGLVELVSAIADAEGTGRFISYATNIPHPEMPAYYAACDILVSPHVHMADGSTFFGSPVKIFEYMAMGKPIVASGIAQLAELLKAHKNALLTKPGDVEGIAEAILTLASDPELRRRLGLAARETCLSQCTWKHNAQRFIDAYHEALHQRTPGSTTSDAEHPPGGRHVFRPADGN